MNPEIETRIVDPPTAPYNNAQTFRAEMFGHLERHRLINHGGVFYAWADGCWTEIEDNALREQLYAFFDAALYMSAPTKKGEEPELVPFLPTRHKIADLLDALRALAHLSRDVVAPAWLDPTSERHPSHYVACTNGLLHVPTRTVEPHTPLMFVHHRVSFDFDPDAGQPELWLQFLGELWPDDPQSIDALRLIFGYILSGSTRLQKIVLLVGLMRSGKGTIARVLRAMLGEHHCAGPTLSGLATNFGLQEMVGKSLAVISDARITDGQSTVVERLLSISGEDMLTIDRKYRDPWSGTLPTRLLMLSNELPRLQDSSGALASRLIILQTTQSFLGREDPDLTDKLKKELPAIFNWALTAVDELAAGASLLQPASSLDAVREMYDLASPISAFIRDRCVLGANRSVRVDVLYQSWRDWCESQGIDRPGSVQTFGRDLRAVRPNVRIVRPLDDDGVNRVRLYRGIDLRGPG